MPSRALGFAQGTPAAPRMEKDVHRSRLTTGGRCRRPPLTYLGFFDRLFIEVAQNGTCSSTRNFSLGGV